MFSGIQSNISKVFRFNNIGIRIDNSDHIFLFCETYLLNLHLKIVRNTGVKVLITEKTTNRSSLHPTLSDK